jgi:transcriptional regulator with XRE-family HTH domain
MTDGSTGSTVPRRQLGRKLRELRIHARLSVRLAAEEFEWSETKMWRIETGQTSMRMLDVEHMCRVYGAPVELTRELKKLAKQTKVKGWWHSYDDVIPETFNIYLGLEESASKLLSYEPELVPGLFQTADYARALTRKRNPLMAEEEVERLVQLRMARKTLLTRKAARPELTVVLNEAVLCRPVGGKQVMAAQLRRLAEISDLPNVALQVVPFSAEEHVGLDTRGFVLLRFAIDAGGRETEPPVVFVEGFTGDLYLDKPKEIETFAAAFTEIVDSALDARASQSYILQAAREFEQ